MMGILAWAFLKKKKKKKKLKRTLFYPQKLTY